MGGTVDGEIFRDVDFEGLEELQRKVNQPIVPLSALEAELAELIDAETRAKMFQDKAETNKDLENQMRDWLKKEGKI